MPITAPAPIAALPSAPSTSAPTTFDADADALLAALPVFVSETNAAAANVFNNALNVEANATSAAASAAAAAASSGAPMWASGTYATGDPVYSPINGLVYRRLTPGGASPTDPSADPTNWSTVATGDVTLNGTQTLANKTLTAPAINTPAIVGGTASEQTHTNPAITNYTETVHAPAAGAAFTVDLANGTMQKLTTNANCTITLPAAAAGKGYTLEIVYGGVHTITWAGGTSIKWPGGTAPTATKVNGKKDIYVFSCFDAAETLGQDGGRNF